MIPVIEEAIKNGTAKSVVNGREYVIDLKNMPILLEFYNIMKALDITIKSMVPLMVMLDYNEGKPCSYQNLLQSFKRGKDPQQIVGETTLYNVVKQFTGLIKLAAKNGKFEGEYPKKGKDATEFVREALQSLVAS